MNDEESDPYFGNSDDGKEKGKESASE